DRKIFSSIVAFILLILVGCEKEIQFDLKETDPKLVVDATIENAQPPIVVLTKSLNYFSKISPAILANSFVHDAEVYVSDNLHTHKLKEYIIPDVGGYNLYYYSVDSANLSTAIAGRLNTKYTLRIVYEGEEYTAGTTIPNITKRID
ncbi:MAG: DUF4249 family protein, partial [Chitinophagaceae bacterium]